MKTLNTIRALTQLAVTLAALAGTNAAIAQAQSGMAAPQSRAPAPVIVTPKAAASQSGAGLKKGLDAMNNR